jgi:putative ABC transport system ATP-binding protein
MSDVMIRTENLSKQFTTGSTSQQILKNIDLDIKRGDFTMIMGKSGSGKSTLLYSLAYMDKPTSGKVLFGNNEVSYKDKALAKLHSSDISFIFQTGNLLHDLTTFENIAIPAYQSRRKDEVNKDTNAILKYLNLEDEKHKYPHEMSGGQQQRVAIARAIVKQPAIIFADEPTGALNSGFTSLVLDYLSEINDDGTSIVMVTHDVKACLRGNRILYLLDGAIVGELILPKYTIGDAAAEAAREQQVLDFLKKYDW